MCVPEQLGVQVIIIDGMCTYLEMHERVSLGRVPGARKHRDEVRVDACINLRRYVACTHVMLLQVCIDGGQHVHCDHHLWVL